MTDNRNPSMPIDAAATVHYENYDIQMHIKDYTMAEGKEKMCIPHWHDDFELVHITSGMMEYRINNDKLILSAGDFLFINTREMHYNKRYSNDPVTAQCILFQPKILSSNPTVQSRYIQPIWLTSPFEYFYYPRNTAQAQKCCSLMDQLLEVRRNEEPGYELEAIGYLHLLMAVIYRDLAPITPTSQGMTYNTDIIKRMISFIYHRYGEKITLKDIAEAGSVSTHKCCDLFREYMSTTPVDFLNNYRLEISTRLLVSTDMNIIGIAQHCGIEQPAYFSKMFKDHYGLTPREYRHSRAAIAKQYEDYMQ